MLKLIRLGFVLYLTGCIDLSVIELMGHRMSPNATCMLDKSVSFIPINYDWALLLKGTGSIISSLTTLIFLIAQSPHQMKGLLYSCYYAFNGITKVWI